MSELIDSYQQLIYRIGECLVQGQQRAFEQVNTLLVETYSLPSIELDIRKMS